MQKFKEQKRREWQEERNRDIEVKDWLRRHHSEDMSNDITFGRRGFVSLNQNHVDESSNQATRRIFDRRNARKRWKVNFDIMLS